MILSAEIHGQYRQVTADELDRLTSEIMTTLAPSDPCAPILDRGETAELYFADTPLTAETFDEPPFDWQAHSVLTVSVNRVTGFGALRWNLKWASANPMPPGDPRVIYDPEVPYWFHPRHTLPLARIEAAVREFCQSEGKRPAGVEWHEFSSAAGSYVDLEHYRANFGKAA